MTQEKALDRLLSAANDIRKLLKKREARTKRLQEIAGIARRRELTPEEKYEMRDLTVINFEDAIKKLAQARDDYDKAKGIV
jgi:hypothetical protein